MDYQEVELVTNFIEDNFMKIYAIPDYRGFPYKNIEVKL